MIKHPLQLSLENIQMQLNKRNQQDKKNEYISFADIQYSR